MPFETIVGLKGKVYVPETQAQIPKKHPCRECFSCQMCADDRCNVCRRYHEDACEYPSGIDQEE